MTIDKEKLKALAEAMLRDEQGAELSGEEVRDFPEAVRSYEAMTAQSAVLALLAEIDRLTTSRSKKERELEQELEVWRHGPSCWSCGDTGDVHDITGEWRGECDCLSAQLINANRERDQLKAENAELKQNVFYSDQIIETRNRLLKSIPACPVHGDECVPHAQEWVEAARKDAERYRC